MTWRRKCFVGALLATSAGMVSTAVPVGSAVAASSPGVTATTIKLGLVTSVSGPASSSFGELTVQAAEARIKLQNAEGGVDGRKLVLVTADDGSSPTQALTAVQSLVSQGVFDILGGSAVFNGAYRYTTQIGIPAENSVSDGPEYADPANKNLFNTRGSIDPGYPGFTLEGKYFKSQGATVAGCVGFGSSSGGVGGCKGMAISAKKYGLNSYVNLTPTFGDVNFTAIALEMKAAGVDAVETEMTQSSNLALFTALAQAGVKLKASLIIGGYSQAVLSTSGASAAAQGLGFAAETAPWELKTTATKQMQAALAKYANYHQPNPQTNQIYGWQSADLAIYGLQHAGKNPTWSSFISNLRKVKNYTDGGLSAPNDFSKFGWADTSTTANCVWVVKVKGTAFVPQSKNPVCGTAIPGTNTA
jgi:branched-chain amino acid transport system substrate-binding protein